MNTKTINIYPIPKELWKKKKLKIIPYELIIKNVIISLMGAEISNTRDYCWKYYKNEDDYNIFLDIGSKVIGLGIDNNEEGEKEYEKFILELMLSINGEDTLEINITNMNWNIKFISDSKISYLAHKMTPPVIKAECHYSPKTKSIYNPFCEEIYGDYYSENSDIEGIHEKIKKELDKIFKRGTYELVYKDQWKKLIDIDYTINYGNIQLLIGFEEKTSTKYKYREIEEMGGLIDLLMTKLKNKWKSLIK